MIRQPTPEVVAFAWWQSALLDPKTPRHDGFPQPGFYARRAIKNGPLIPVHVFLEQEIDELTGELSAPEEVKAEELGRPKDPVPIWTHLRPITRDAFNALVEEHRTNQQMAATHVAFDITAIPMRP